MYTDEFRSINVNITLLSYGWRKTFILIEQRTFMSKLSKEPPILFLCLKLIHFKVLIIFCLVSLLALQDMNSIISLNQCGFYLIVTYCK